MRLRAAARRALLACALAWIGACGRWDAPPAEPAGAADLVECAAERGIDYVNRSGGPEKAFILEANGAGVALLDLGSDGDLDIVLAQGLARFDALRTGPGADLEVWENDGAGRFARRAGPGLSGWWTGLVSGDFDNDGDDDLAAGGYGDLAILLQGADGTLTRRVEAGVEPPPERRLAPGAARPPGSPPPRWTTSIAVLDADGDGVLDLYAANYLDLDPEKPPEGSLGKPPLDVPCRWKGVEVYCGPHGLAPQADQLFLGLGDGRFRDESGRLEALQPAFGLGAHAFDADGDRDDDLYIANDSQPNMLWLNDGQGRFVDGALALGVAYGAEGRAQAPRGDELLRRTHGVARRRAAGLRANDAQAGADARDARLVVLGRAPRRLRRRRLVGTRERERPRLPGGRPAGHGHALRAGDDALEPPSRGPCARLAPRPAGLGVLRGARRRARQRGGRP
jgi:hypothetical protein